MTAKNHRIAWISGEDPPDAFPNPEQAMKEPDGLLAAGGDLSPERLLHAYRHGIFPWYDSGQPILWWSPNPRCIIEPADFRLARRLRREIAGSRLKLTFNRDFGAVIDACASPRRTGEGTWITPEMNAAYRRLHDLGWAHSIEVWNDGRLTGGVYGVAIGQAFFGESMFSHETNASKCALYGLSRIMQELHMTVLDCQVCSAHLMSLGAITLPRRDFLARLATACSSARPVNQWPGQALPLKDFLASPGATALQ